MSTIIYPVTIKYIYIYNIYIYTSTLVIVTLNINPINTVDQFIR